MKIVYVPASGVPPLVRVYHVYSQRSLSTEALVKLDGSPLVTGAEISSRRTPFAGRFGPVAKR